MRIGRYLRSSFSARLSLWVTGFVTAIFVVALTLLFRFSLAVVKDETLEQNMQVLEHAALRVDRMLHQTEVTAKTAGWMIRQHMAQPNVIKGLCQEVMASNPWIDSCYVVPRERLKVEAARWHEPSLDAVADSVALRPMTLTYYLPVADDQGKPCMAIGIDVPIDWMEIHEDITTKIPYGQCFLQGVGGRHRYESGSYHKEQIDGRAVYQFYRPFSHDKWGIAMFCPERDVMAGYHRLQTTAIVVMVAVLLLLLLLCRIVIDRNLKPLDLLSEKVRRISQNHFDEPIPADRRLDEIGGLQRSFSTMQQSLASHLSEMHQKTAELQERSQALQAAYERGLEDERTKTAFLSMISAKIMEPVEAIHAATDRLGTHYQRLTKEEMNQIQQQISIESDTITKLIDQTLMNAL